MINDNQNTCCRINSRGSCRNPTAQYLIFVLTRAETQNDLGIFPAYVNTKRNSIADQETRVPTGLTSGAEAEDRTEEYVWAARTLPDYTVENWTLYVEDLLTQANNQDRPQLWRDPDRPTPLFRRAAGRDLNTRPAGGGSEGDGFFEHCSGTTKLSEALAKLGCKSLGSSEIDEYALEFQMRVLDLADTMSVDFGNSPIGQPTQEEKHRLRFWSLPPHAHNSHWSTHCEREQRVDRLGWRSRSSRHSRIRTSTSVPSSSGMSQLGPMIPIFQRRARRPQPSTAGRCRSLRF